MKRTLTFSFLRRILGIIPYFLFFISREGSAQNVGIGTPNPLARLHIVDSSVVFSATDAASVTPRDPPIQFHGRRMMWYADKAAFRVGYVPDHTWDKDSIGNYSFAAGNATMAKGHSSIALGYSAAATGNSSVALGNYALATGDYATSLGWTSIASGESATAMGYGTKALNMYSTAMGFNTTASGDYATAFGSGTTASGIVSTAMGQGKAEGNWSTAMGYLTHAFGSYSTTLGNQTQALGTYSLATGLQTTASGQASTAMGFGTSSSGIASTALGQFTIASGNYSVAAGKNVSTNGKMGAFFFGDSDPNSRGMRPIGFSDQFAARFNGGYYFISSDVGSDIGVRVVAGGNSWVTISDARRKENFLPVNGEDFLRKISTLNLTTWNYIGQDAKTFRHYGPMAQEFFAAFGNDQYGTIGCDTLINQHDFLGVNLIAIQALEKRTTELKQALRSSLGTIDQLKKQNELLIKRIELLEKLIQSN